MSRHLHHPRINDTTNWGATMSRSLTQRRAVQSIKTALAPKQQLRCFSQSASRYDDKPTQNASSQPQRRSSTGILQNIYGASPAQQTNPSSAMGNLSNSSIFQTLGKSSLDTSSLFGNARSQPAEPTREDDLEPFHLHIYCHKHNTHVTCTKPNRDAIISMSTGQVGFRKGKRKGYDSAYSLTKYVLERLLHTGWPPKINRLELVLRGHGKGREGALKVLMSPEGKIMREKIVRVSDSTRIKFGGTRGQRARRL